MQDKLSSIREISKLLRLATLFANWSLCNSDWTDYFAWGEPFKTVSVTVNTQLCEFEIDYFIWLNINI